MEAEAHVLIEASVGLVLVARLPARLRSLLPSIVLGAVLVIPRPPPPPLLLPLRSIGSWTGAPKLGIPLPLLVVAVEVVGGERRRVSLSSERDEVGEVRAVRDVIEPLVWWWW